MPVITTKISKCKLRFATRRDIPTVLALIQALAAYEKRPQDVTATEQGLSSGLFSRKYAEVLLTEFEGEAVGYALFYPVFSSFAGKPGMYLEDLYINPDLRGLGLGKETLRQLAKLANKRGWNALHWSCLDWNQPSIDFYLSIGAKPKPTTKAFSLIGQSLADFVGE